MTKQEWDREWSDLTRGKAWKCFLAYCQHQETILCKALPEYSVVSEKDRADFLIVQERMRVFRDLYNPNWLDQNVNNWVRAQLKEEE